MQHLNEEHDYHATCNSDVSAKTNIKIWLYFILMGFGLFVTLIALIIMYRFWLEEEQIKKIGLVQTHESVDYKAMMKAYVSGDLSVFQDKKSISINDAIQKFLTDYKK